jgi:hypothetical protein
MTQAKKNLAAFGTASAGDVEAIQHLQQSLAKGQHWYLALLGAIGLWSSAVETYRERPYRYLIDGEAFDLLLLAERLCETVNGLLPEGEKDALLFRGISPLPLDSAEVRQLIGDIKYCQYLNYFYGIIVEEALVLAVQEEIDKERRSGGLRAKVEIADEPYRRIYNMAREPLLRRFRQERGYARLKSTSLSELKEFTYWLFKYRLKSCEKARIASDTKKALDYLKYNWGKKGTSRPLAIDLSPPFPPP